MTFSLTGHGHSRSFAAPVQSAPKRTVDFASFSLIGARLRCDAGNPSRFGFRIDTPWNLGVIACTQLSTLARRSPVPSTTITVRLEGEVKDRLDQLAESTQRSKSFLASEAIREFVERNEWQIAETRAALKEADAGDFASARDVARFRKKWKLNAD